MLHENFESLSVEFSGNVYRAEIDLGPDGNSFDLDAVYHLETGNDVTDHFKGNEEFLKVAGHALLSKKGGQHDKPRR